MPRKPKADTAAPAVEIDLPETEPAATSDAVVVASTEKEFDAQQWRVAALVQAALMRRLLDDGTPGQSRMVAAEISAAIAYLKQYATRAPGSGHTDNPFAQFED